MIEVNVNPKGEGHDVMVAVNGNFKELLTEAFLAIGTICASIREIGPVEGATTRAPGTSRTCSLSGPKMAICWV